MATEPLKPNTLIGTRWRNKRTGREYRVTKTHQSVGDVYLQCQTKGGRSTWKYVGLLEYDYERITEAKQNA